MLSPPARSEVKLILEPSGLNRGCTSYEGPEVNRVALPPLIGSVYRSPSTSNTSVFPSGLTSIVIQVASSVVNTTSFVGPWAAFTSHFLELRSWANAFVLHSIKRIRRIRIVSLLISEKRPIAESS